ncbi:unnamed protein product [Clonostachys chloroleuca]|uniref:Enoyl reductase (ER) domain-containing protein n=1 Tax=Clonostachys chloroleuca TaxID=1926264 RepID=A0AA35M0J3_9HYPO|nr:unnamed protein product [Clonostachys chloroleuca]
MKALILDASRHTASVQDVSYPELGEGELLVKVHAVALNPVDALYVYHPLARTGRTVGSDFAGTVAAVSDSGIPSVQVGDRVAGFLQGACSSNERPGAFAEYVVCPADLVWRVPSSTTLEDASAVSLCALTAAQAVFFRLGLPAPFDWGRSEAADDARPLSFFIYGASSSVGLYAAQLIRHSAEAASRTVHLIGTASKARFPLLQAEPYSYDALVDYRERGWVQQVRSHSNDGFNYAFDCISEGPTVRQVSGLLRDGGRMAIVRSREGGAWEDGDLPVEPIYGAVWEGLGAEILYQNLVVPVSEDARRFAASFYRWLSSGAPVTPNPVRLMPGGLDKIVPDGFALLGSGSMEDRQRRRTEAWMKPISGEKLVYRIDEGGRDSQDQDSK